MGYFSVTADGASTVRRLQFGHLFASGPEPRGRAQNLVMALKELFIMGEIATVEYLGELLETDAFKQNTIDPRGSTASSRRSRLPLRSSRSRP